MMASPRLKQPAFGRSLLNQRLRGDHPKRVWVIYGEDWQRRPSGSPSVCVGEDWEPYSIDWTCVTGLPVHIVWRSGERARELAAEIAGEAVQVWIHYLGENGRPQQDTVDFFLFDAAQRPELVRLWSPAAREKYLASEAEFYAAMLADLTRSPDGQQRRTA